MNSILSDLCEFINGGAWSDKEYVSTGIPVLKVSNLRRDGIDFSGLNFISEESRDKYKKHFLFKDDLVVATVGSHPSLINSAAGRASIIPTTGEGYLLNQNAVCLRTKNSNVLDQKYLGYVGKTDSFQHFIQQRGRGAANQMRIAIGAIKEYSLELPPIGIQRKISSILSSYDDLIENNLKRIKLLEELAERSFENWYTVGTWSEISLGKLVEHEIGGGWGSDNKHNDFTEGAFVIRGTDIDKVLLGDIGNVPYRYHKESNLASRELQNGDIVFEVSGGSSYEGVAKTLLLKQDILNQFGSSVMCASFCKLIRPINTELSNFIFLFLRLLRKNKVTEVFEIRSASNIVNYNWSAFLKFQMVKVPDDKSLKKFNYNVDSILNQIINLGHQNRLLKEARNILLPRLMSGEINVEESEDELMSIAAEPIKKYKTKHSKV